MAAKKKAKKAPAKKAKKTKKSKETRSFKRLFPSVFKTIRLLKKKSYKNVAHLLQRCESSIIIGRVCTRMMVEHPDVPLYTIHDAVLTTKEHVQTVENVMNEVFSTLVLTPTISTTDYGAKA